MSGPGKLPQVAKADIFARLAQGVRAGTTVITPTRRLAAALKREFDDAQALSGHTAWESADILHYSAFIERIYEEVLYSERAAAPPALLSSAQDQALWESIIRSSAAGEALLAVSETA
jgi:ATP-dependent helicase/nuclease subunit B